MSAKTVAKKPRAAQGTAEWKGGCWHAKVSLPGGGRKRVKLERPDGSLLDSKERDRALAKKMSADISKLIRSDAFQAEQRTKDARVRVREFGESWTSGELFELHGSIKRLKPKASARDDHNRLDLHVYPYLGHMAVPDVQEEDVEQAFRKAFAAAEKRNGEPLRAATKRHIYQVTHRLFDLAVKPGRLRTDNPVSVDLLPEKDSEKLYCFLYPDELLAVLACELVPLVRRVYYALAAYTGLRKGSLKAFTWASLDFENSTITSLVSKTGLAQIFAQADPLEPGLGTLMVLLRRYYDHCGRPNTDSLLITDLQCKKDGEAAALRDDLKTAGVTRALLFAISPKVEPLRFHDLRATFVTWARRAGKGDGWISDRTGHLTPEIMKRYDRGARLLADLKYKPFPDVSTVIPELSKDLLTNVTRLPPRR